MLRALRASDLAGTHKIRDGNTKTSLHYENFVIGNRHELLDIYIQTTALISRSKQI